MVGKQILVGAIIGVRTSGMLMVVKWTLSPMHSEATTRVHESSAAFRGHVRPRSAAGSYGPIEETSTISPDLRSRMCGSRPMMSLLVPR
jgi:hypothetical protein